MHNICTADEDLFLQSYFSEKNNQIESFLLLLFSFNLLYIDE